jgi:hypothetical protein
MRKTDKYIKEGKKKRTKPDLSVESVLKNKKYFAILKLILWSDCHNKKIQTCNMIYALVKDHGKIDANDVRTKNRYEKFYSGNILKEVITPKNVHNSGSTLRNYISNLGEKKLGLIKLVHVKNVKKKYDYYQTTDKFKVIMGKKMLHRAVEKLPEEPGIYSLIIKKISESLIEFEEMKSDIKEADTENIDDAELLKILLLMKDLAEYTETSFQYDEIVNLLEKK